MNAIKKTSFITILFVLFIFYSATKAEANFSPSSKVKNTETQSLFMFKHALNRWEKLESKISSKKGTYERTSVYEKRILDSKIKYQEFISTLFTSVIFLSADNDVRYNWEDNTVSFQLSYPVNVLTEKSREPKNNFAFTIPIETESTGFQMQEFPNNISVEIFFKFTDAGYIRVYRNSIRFKNKEYMK